MAVYAKSGTLTASAVASVDITTLTRYVGIDWDGISDGIWVINRSQSGQIWVRLDGEDPTVAGDDCYVVLGARFFPNPKARGGDAGEAVTVKLISSAALDYTVEGTVRWA